MAQYIFNDDYERTIREDTVSALRESPRYMALKETFARCVSLIAQDAVAMMTSLRIKDAAAWGLARWAAIVDEPRGDLTVDEWARVVRAKAVALRSAGDGTSLAILVEALFPERFDYRVIDAGAASLVVEVILRDPVSAAMRPRVRALMRLAKAAGVRLDVVHGVSPAFAFDDNPDDDGFDVGFFVDVI
jgi:hypothetical protein